MSEPLEHENLPDPVLAEAITALAASLLPDEVQERLDGKIPRSIAVRAELPVLLRQGFEQAGIGRTEVALQTMQVELDHLKKEVHRLERQQDKGMTDGRVVTIVLSVMTPLLTAAYFLSKGIG